MHHVNHDRTRRPGRADRVKLLERAGAVLGLERASVALDTAANFAATTSTTVSAVSNPDLSTFRAQRVAISVARSIPAVRRAERAITTAARFPLVAYDSAGARLAPNDQRAAWLKQPCPNRTLRWLITKTLQDGIWHDRAVWKVLDRRAADRAPVKFERVHPDRISTIEAPNDPDTVDGWVIDGHLISADEFASRYVLFDFAGLGGLSRFGAPLLTLYADLQAAAGNYATAPHPKAVLMNEGGAELDEDEVDLLLAEWEAARNTSSVGYLEGLDYKTVGWNAQELQLTESREHAALEVARLFGLPAFAVDAKSGDPMTYSTTVDRRRDLLDAAEDWHGVIPATLSMDDRSSINPRGLVLPYGVTAGFLTDDYVRDTPSTRMATWSQALAARDEAGNPILTLDEIRALEPLARKTS